MPNRQQRRSGDTPQMGFRVTLSRTPRGPETYEIELDNLSALDEATFTQGIASLTGEHMTFFEAFQRVSTYTVAAFVWLERRRGEKQLPFQDVLKEVRVRDLSSFETMGEDEEDEGEVADVPVDGANPEHSGELSDMSSQGSPPSTG